MKKENKNKKAVVSTPEVKGKILSSEVVFSSRKYMLFLGFITFILFANTISNGYNMDDNLVTQNHPLTSRGLEAIGEIFTSPYYSDAMGYAYGYRPIVHVSYAIEHAFFGEKPGVSHFFNVILYVLSVLLFFKLLVKWVGEKNVLLATIIALLFAVHPIHTEVVASLKNRDEILAFLFVILAGLSLEKYFSKQNLISLFFVLLYFLLAMLSKKSVYPMILVLPVVTVLLREIALKHLLLGTIALVIPGAIVASELQMQKVIFFAMLPMVSILVVYFLVNELKKVDFSWRRFFLNTNFWSISSLLITLYACYTNNFLFAPVSFLTACVAYYLDQKIGVVALSFVTGLIGSFFYYFELKNALVLILFFPLMSAWSKKEKPPVWALVVAGLYLVFLMLDEFKPSQIASIVALALFVFLVLKRMLFALIYAIVILVISLTIKIEIPYFAIMLFLFLGLHATATTKNNAKFLHLFPLLFCVVMIFSPRFLGDLELAYQFKFPSVEQVQTMASTATVDLNNQSILKEGRMLEYVENTLVTPHTAQEKIATGFATLGEYFRLHIFPVELSFYYGFSKVKTENLSSVWIWISILVHLFLLVLAVINLRSRPLLTIGVGWYLLSILLFSNWVELVAGMVGERLAFSASAGFCIAFVVVLFWIKPLLFQQKWTWVEGLLVLIFVLLSGRTVVRNGQWENQLTLMSADIGHLTNSAQANNLYALNLMAYSLDEPSYSQEQRLEMQQKAIMHFEKAVHIWPEFMNAHYDIGRSAGIVGDVKKSIRGYKRAIALDSTFFDAYYNLLNVYDQAGEKENYFDLATILFQKNKNVMEYSVLARGYYLKNDLDNCLKVLKEGIQVHPESPDLKSSFQQVELEMLKKN